MKRLYLFGLLLLFVALPSRANQRAYGFCTQDAPLAVSGLTVTPDALGSFPLCTVTVYLAGTTSLAQIYSDNSGTVLANPFIAQTTSYWWFYAANGRYDVKLSGAGMPNPITLGDIELFDSGAVGGLFGVYQSPPCASSMTLNAQQFSIFDISLTCNVISSSVTNPIQIGEVIVINLTQDAVGSRTFAWPSNLTNTSFFTISSAALSQTPTVWTWTGTVWKPAAGGGGGGGGGGGSSQLPLNSFQKAASAGAFATSNVSETGGVLIVNDDGQLCGPTPYYDIRCFGATQSSATATGSITTGTATLTLTSNPDFINGQGIVVYGAGGATTLTTPGTPTVTPNVTNGATTWNYKVAAQGTQGGMTAASAAGTTTTGGATLGLNTITTTATGAISGGVLTITTPSAHGMMAGNPVVLGGGISGEGTIASVPSGTTFTLNVGQAGNLSGLTGIIVKYKVCNTLTFPAASFSGSATERTWTYRSQGAGAYSISNVQIGLDPYLVDCGEAAPTAPSYVPSTPSGAQNAYLATTILSGGGTTTLTLAANAASTATSQAVLHDQSAALIAAMNAAATGPIGGTVRIPAVNPQAYWQFNSTADLRSVNATGANAIDVIVDGYVALNEPWIVRSNLNFIGLAKRTSSFMYTGGSVLSGNGYPLIYGKVATGVSFRRFFLSCNAAQCKDAFFDTDGGGNGSVGITFEDTDAFSNTGTAQNIVIKGGFDYFFRGFTCDPNAGGTQLPAPCLRFTDSSTAVEATSQMGGRVVIDRSWFNNSGIQIDDTPNGNEGGAGGYNFNHILFESLLVSPFRINNSRATNGYLFSDNLLADLQVGTSTPVIDFSGTPVASNVNWVGGLIGNGNWPLVIGPSGLNITVFDAPTNNYGNTQLFVSSAGSGQQTTQIGGHTLDLVQGGRVVYQMANPGPVTGLSLGSGGTVSTGAHTYAVSAVDADGSETLLGPGASITVTTGNQIVNGNTPSLPTGATGFGFYQDNFRVQVNGTCNLPQIPGNATTFSFTGTGCGNSNPSLNTAGQSILSSSGIKTNQYKTIDSSGFAVTNTTSPLTANHAQSSPNADGVQVVCNVTETGVPTGQTFLTVNGGACVPAPPGLADGNSGAHVSTTPYNVKCDTGTTSQLDRATTLVFDAGASVVNLPDHTISGCGGNFNLILVNESTGNLTVNRGGSDVLNVVGLSGGPSISFISFTLPNNTRAAVNNGEGGIWNVGVSSASSGGGGGTTVVPSTNAYFQDDFNCNSQGAVLQGCLSWGVQGSGAATSKYTGTGTGNYWGALTCTTSATATNFCALQQANFSFPFYSSFTGGSIIVRARIGATTNLNFFAGIYDSNSGHGETAPGYAGVAYSVSASDTGWMCVVFDGTTAVRTAVAGTLDTNFHTFTITWTAAKTIQCQVDGGSATSMASTHFPTDAAETPQVSVDNNGTANAELFTIDYYYHNLTGLAR